MKRIYSFLSLLFIGGMMLWANNPSVSFGQIKPRNGKSIQCVTLLDNPTLKNNPLFKKRLEESYLKGTRVLKEGTFGSHSPFSMNVEAKNCLNNANNDESKSLKAPAATSIVECEVLYDKNVFSPNMITFYNPEINAKLYFDYDPDTWELIPTISSELPEGEYTAYAYFWIVYDEDGRRAKEGSHALVFKENIKIPYDGKIIFDASEATNQIKFDAVLPDGQNSNLEVYDNINHEIIREGNVSSMGAMTFIVDKDFGPINSLFTSAFCSSLESDGIRDSDIWVNNLSDRFCAYRIIIMNTDEDMITACQYIGELAEGKTQTMNKAESYKK